jgi:putative phosphoesterase
VKILVISDTHLSGSIKDIPKAIYDEARTCDLIIHAGDVINPEILKKLKAIGQVKAVYGNMDPDEIRNKLPAREIVKAGKFKIGLVHGEGAPANLVDYAKKAFKSEKLDCIIFGHSHSPLNEVVDGCLMFNPGSVTDKIFATFNSYGILETNGEIKGRIIKING